MTDPDLAIASNAAIVRSNELLSESNDRIAELGRYGRRSRRLIRGLIVSLMLDVVLTGGLGFVLNQASGAANTSKQAANAAHALSVLDKENIVAACLAGNRVRANDILIWTDFLSTPSAVKQHGPPDRDPILILVRKTFAPRVCQ